MPSRNRNRICSALFCPPAALVVGANCLGFGSVSFSPALPPASPPAKSGFATGKFMVDHDCHAPKPKFEARQTPYTRETGLTSTQGSELIISHPIPSKSEDQIFKILSDIIKSPSTL
ncbi:hypothetical protein SLEP1_g26120 [Rubroshorea leprosula]|uniref:Uncharacterized protein n=1 Tax=Rubroshorea leprosula TaxID=152421 RepID=A0AAV5JL54_9ROSI|nr:hypothetical protein SLEP1_g26120 [Rubroshorea leprosula]